MNKLDFLHERLSFFDTIVTTNTTVCDHACNTASRCSACAVPDRIAFEMETRKMVKMASFWQFLAHSECIDHSFVHGTGLQSVAHLTQMMKSVLGHAAVCTIKRNIGYFICQKCDVWHFPLLEATRRAIVVTFNRVVEQY